MEWLIVLAPPRQLNYHFKCKVGGHGRTRRGAELKSGGCEAAKPKLQAAVTALCERLNINPVPRVDRPADESNLRALLQRVSTIRELRGNDELKLTIRANVRKCRHCDAVIDDDHGCEHNEPGCRNNATTRRTTQMMDQPYVTGIRIRETFAQSGYFGNGCGVGRGGGQGKKSKGKAKKVKKAEDSYSHT